MELQEEKIEIRHSCDERVDPPSKGNPRYIIEL